MGIRRQRPVQPISSGAHDILSAQGVDLAMALLTRKEVEVIAGIPPSVLNKAIEQEVVPVRDAQIEPCDLAALTFIRDLPFPLSVVAKRALAAWMRIAAEGEEFELAPGLMARRTPATDAVVREATAYVVDRERYYACTPDVMFGEPVIRGTRIPLRTIKIRVDAGDSYADLERDYPYLEPAAFRFAVRWAACNPRRGRPAEIPEEFTRNRDSPLSPARKASRDAYIAARAARRAAAGAEGGEPRPAG
jgi:uncharacterized protein (DUF433 family)